MSGSIVRRHAIVGTGGIAHAHAKALRDLSDRAELVAAADIDEVRVKNFCDEWALPAAHTSLTAILEIGDVDVVHLCTPPGLHRDQAIEALEAGVHVVCEKPPTLSLAELDDIRAAEQRSSAWYATIFQHRFGSAAAHLRELAGSQLGQAMAAVCNTLWFRGPEYFDVPWRGLWRVEGGGPTMGHGIHQFDLLLSILGGWDDVTAVARLQARPTNTEDLSAAVVSFENGAVATIVNSLVSPRESSYLRFDYQNATVEIEHLYGYTDDEWVFTPANDREELATAWASGLKGQVSGHTAQVAAVLDALETETAPPVTSDQARNTLELIAAIYASSFTGEHIRRGDITPGSPFYSSMDGTGAPWPAVKEGR